MKDFYFNCPECKARLRSIRFLANTGEHWSQPTLDCGCTVEWDQLPPAATLPNISIEMQRLDGREIYDRNTLNVLAEVVFQISKTL